MASGDTLVVFTPQSGEPPATASNGAVFTVQNGHLCLSFDADTDKEIVFPGFLPAAYGGGGLTVTLVWMANATANECDWEVQIERHQDNTDNLNTTDFPAAANGVIATTAGTAYVVNYDDVTFTDGADMDSLAAGESFRLKVRRDADDVTNDDLAAAALLLRVIVKET